MPFDRQLFFKELGRKAFHMAGCVIPAAYYFFVSREIMAVLLAACVVGAGILEYMRLTGRDVYPSSYMRPSEKGRLAAYFYAAAAMFLAVMLLQQNYSSGGHPVPGLRRRHYRTRRRSAVYVHGQKVHRRPGARQVEGWYMPSHTPSRFRLCW